MEDRGTDYVIESDGSTNEINLIEGRKGSSTGNIDPSLNETLEKVTHHGSTAHEQSKKEWIKFIRSPNTRLDESYHNRR
jgi:hypothetical protein